MKIAVGSDHGGYAYKKQLIPFMEELGHEVMDMGSASPESVDYPDYALPVAKAVAQNEYDRGVLICGTGIGVSICANKVRGIRCALCADPVTARLAREHTNTNILALGARIIGIEVAKETLRIWLETPFSDDDRHARRISKITDNA